MEYIQKKKLHRSGIEINGKVIFSTILITFLIGRVVVFGNTFPCAIALITVMLSINTVNIYLVPVLWLSMMTYYDKALLCYGDLAAIVVCSLLYLFLHTVKLTTAQRTAITLAVTAATNSMYFILSNMIYLLKPEILIKELIVIAVLINIFEVGAKVILSKEHDKNEFSAEEITLCIVLAMCLCIFGIGQKDLILGFTIFFAVGLQSERGIISAIIVPIGFSALGIITNTFEHPETLAVLLATGLLAGDFLGKMTKGQYQKTIFAVAQSGVFFLADAEEFYIVAIASAVLIAVPSQFLSRLYLKAKEKIMPTETTYMDLRLEGLRGDIERQKENFNSLGQLYSMATDDRQIISYQFKGMEKVADKIISILDKNSTLTPCGPSYKAETGIAKYSLEGVSGDSCLTMTLSNNKTALILSDGMGKGEKAAVESKLVVTTLGKLLDAGFDVDLAMKTINGIMLTKTQSEIFATVDLAIISHKTGRAKLFKMGAATSFIKHGDQVEMVKTPALPIGIIGGLKLEYIDVKLKKGDLLVMVSDGVTDCDREDPGCKWLISRLKEMTTKDPETIAELIVNKAAEKYQLKERDDLTVMVATLDKVSKAV